MVQRRDSMLEAFRDATSKESAPAGGPFVEPAAAAALPVIHPDARRIVGWLIGLGVAFLVGVLVGRGTVRKAPDESVQAAPRAELDDPWLDDEQAAGIGSALAGGSGPAASEDEELPAGAPPDFAALYSKRNKYTIVAIAYDRANEDLAWENYDHLRSNGLPAFPPFESKNKKVVIVVGAAPLESELKDVRSRLQRLAGPNGRGRPYEEAYYYSIRKLIGD